MAIKADVAKIHNAVEALIKETLGAGKTVCFYDMNAMMASLKLSSLPKSKYHDEFADALTSTDLHQRLGDWITAEYECNIYVLVQLAPAGELQSVCDEKKNHFNLFNEMGMRALRKSFPLKKKKVTVPEGISAAEAEQALAALAARKENTGNIADLHNEDIRRQAAVSANQ